MAEAIMKEKNRSGFFSILQRVGRAFMLPIALLPIAGLLLGVGASLTNTAMLEAYNLTAIMGPGTVAYSIFSLLASVGTVIFDNLPLLFAMGVALGMAIKAQGMAEGGAIVAQITLFAVLIYEIVGPAVTKISLMKAGEISPEGKTSARKSDADMQAPADITVEITVQEPEAVGTGNKAE